MTTNEQIIIDGVDVSGCGHYFNKGCLCSGLKSRGAFCLNNPNCYYKQLQRKTAECEDLKERLAVANFEIESLQESQEPFKQHLDKLERKLQIATEALKFYATSHPDGSINTAQQALEQIESEAQ